ncbi:MAG: DEAD/DEAH box helicase [Thermoplasmata archaeon]
MTILHAALAWAGFPRYECDLLVWAEAEGVPLPVARRSRRPIRSHPFAADPESLVRWIEGYARTIRTPELRSTRETVRLRLPTRAGVPVPSGTLAGSTEERSVRLRDWAVSALRTPYVEALPWLAALPSGEEPEELPRLGGDLRYLSRVAKFVFALLLRRKIVPTLVEGPGGVPEARWLASLTTDEELEEGRRLKELTPRSLLAARGKAEYPSAGSLIRALLDTGVDGLAREWLAGSAPPPRTDLPEGRWIAALANPAPRFSVPARLRGELRDGVERWTGNPADAPTRFRTCFRLDPPPSEDGAGVVTLLDASGSTWAITALLQARDDPSQFVPADKAVLDPSTIPPRPGGVAAEIADRLLADLRQAGVIYPLLRGMLAGAVPSPVAASTEQAYDFLRLGAPLLSECGFGVMAPPWWSHGPPPIGFRLRMRPSEDREGFLGLEGLVRYDLSIAMGEHALSRAELGRLAQLKIPLVRFRGQWVEVRPEDVAAALRALDQRRRGSTTLRELMSADIDGRFDGMPLLGVVPSPELRELWGALRGDVHFQEVLPPQELRTELRPYQVKGYSWLTFWRRLGLGACLADDMGLGKTVQCLSVLLGSQRARGPKRPALLVCPTSVVENWRREAARFTPSLKVHVHHGETRRRRPAAFVARARTADLTVTSYALLWRDAAALGALDWDTVILDEAQNIKNPLAKASQCAFALRARHRIALTGTPVENRLSELWSIMQFLNPGLLGPLASFESRFSTPIERYSDPEASRLLQRLIRPLILRRLKSDPQVAPDLPAKIETRVDCPLTPEQATLYEATVREMMERIERAEGMGRRALVLTTLTKLKQVCDHPALLLKDRSAIPGRSGKLERLEAMLEEVLAEGDRALVFTQWREMGEMLRKRISERFGCGVGYFHGGLTVAEREHLLGSFQGGDGAQVLVLTLKAGGSGINLTAANRVFHFDRWWNPAVENQATDRSYRIGQRRNVMVHKLVVVGTLEERIDDLLKKKSGLAEAVLSKGDGALTELSTADLRELFALNPDTSVPRDSGVPMGPGAAGR